MLDFILGIAFSVHIGLDGSYNGIHPNIRLENDDFMVGAYLNSEEKLSVYAGVNHEITSNIDIEYGLVTGYDAFDYPVVPFTRFLYKIDENNSIFVAPVAESLYNGNNFGINIGYELTIGK